MKILTYLLVLLIVLSTPTFSQVRSMSPHNKERKKLWRRWSKRRDAYNPYLTKKNRDKPSVKMARSDKRELKRQRRAFKRQTRRAKRAGTK
jgi:hypothetical protein